MSKLSFLSLPALLLLLAFAARADGLDATKSLSCAVSKISECDGVAACSEATLEQIDLPGVWRVDFGARQLASEDGQRTSPINVTETLGTVLLIQGQQNGRGWTMVIERATGHLSATVTDVEGVFVLAGGCTAE